MNMALIGDAKNNYPSIPLPRRSMNADAPSSRLEVRGIAASLGRYTGRVCLIENESEIGKVLTGDVVVWAARRPIPYTVLRAAGALVGAGCGVLSATATIARELAMPAVMGVGPSVELLCDGQRLEVDGGLGLIRIQS